MRSKIQNMAEVIHIPIRSTLKTATNATARRPTTRNRKLTAADCTGFGSAAGRRVTAPGMTDPISVALAGSVSAGNNPSVSTRPESGSGSGPRGH